MSSGLQAVNAAYRAEVGEHLPDAATTPRRFKQLDRQQQEGLVERIRQLSLLVGPHHLRDLVRSSINVLLVLPEIAEQRLQAWGEFFGEDREEVLRWMGGLSLRSRPSLHPLVREASELIGRYKLLPKLLALSQADVMEMVWYAYAGFGHMTVEGVSRHWTALSRGPFLQHPPWSEDWHVAAPSSKANILSYGPRLSGRLEYLVQVGQQGSWSLGAVAWCSAKKWDERFPGYAAHAEQLAQAAGPA